MLEYLSNLLPRLRQYSETLDKKEIFIDQPWILVDKGVNKQQYIFERNGRLLLSVNGDTEIGKWEYVSAAKSLLIHVGNDHTMLKQDFVNKGLLVLRKGGLINRTVLLLNEASITDLNVEGYLRYLLQTHLDIRWIETESGVVFEYEAATGEKPSRGTSVFVEGNKPEDGTYKIKGENLYLIVEDGLVQKTIRKAEYLTNKGRVCINRQSGYIVAGDFVHLNNIPVPDGRYELQTRANIDYFETINGRITVVKKYDPFETISGGIPVEGMVCVSTFLKENNTKTNNHATVLFASPVTEQNAYTIHDDNYPAYIDLADFTSDISFAPVPEYQVKDRIESFILAANTGDVKALKQYLANNIEKYYKFSHVSVTDVINEVIRYNTQEVADARTLINKDSMDVITTSTGYIVRTNLVDLSTLRKNGVPYHYITKSEFHLDKDLRLTYATGSIVEKDVDYLTMLNLTPGEDADKFYDQINKDFFNQAFLKLSSPDISACYKDAMKTSLHKFFDKAVIIQRSDRTSNNFYGFCELLSMGLVQIDGVTGVYKYNRKVYRIDVTLM